jgi:hypothetical protein
MKIRSLAIGVVIAVCVAFAAPAKAQDRTAVVARIKAALVSKGVDLNGACGSFQITERVAWELHNEGFKFLRKAGGNRAVPQPDGSCLDGDHTSAPGYATDYLISLNEGGVGYDLLGDGGGANNPQWGGPESDSEMVARNLKNFGEPFNPGDGTVANPPTGPGAPPAGSPAVDLQPLKDAISALTLQVADLQAKLQALAAELDTADHETQEKIEGLNQLVGAIQTRKVPTGCRVPFLGCRLE